MEHLPVYQSYSNKVICSEQLSIYCILFYKSRGKQPNQMQTDETNKCIAAHYMDYEQYVRVKSGV